MDRLLDVYQEFPKPALEQERDPNRTVYEALHAAATLECEKVGARLRHTEPAEVHKATATTFDGRDVIVVATRWVVDAPTAA